MDLNVFWDYYKDLFKDTKLNKDKLFNVWNGIERVCVTFSTFMFTNEQKKLSPDVQMVV